MRGLSILSLLLLISLASSTPILEFQHEEIQPGETILGTITTSGNFEEILDSDRMKFYEGRKSIFLEHDITEYNGTYYFYIYTTREGNFTLEISNVLYQEDEFSSIDFKKDFEVKSEYITYSEEVNDSGNITEVEKTKTEIISIKPGFIDYGKQNQITITNKGSGIIEIVYGRNESTLYPSESIKTNSPESENFSFFEISTYKDFEIPVILQISNKTLEVSPIVDLEEPLKLDTSQISLNLTSGEDYAEIIEIFNFADEPLLNMSSNSDFSSIKLETPSNLSGRDSKNITLSISTELEGFFEGLVNITYTKGGINFTNSILLQVYILPSGSNQTSFETVSGGCESINGTVCGIGENCQGVSSFTKNSVSGDIEYCCIGTCELAKTSSESGSGSYGILIGILILLALGGAGYFLYTRYKKVKPESTSETFKKAQESLDKKMNRRPTS